MSPTSYQLLYPASEFYYIIIYEKLIVKPFGKIFGSA